MNLLNGRNYKSSILERLISLNRALDLTIIWCDKEIDYCSSTMKNFKGRKKKTFHQKFIEAKVDLERVTVYRNEVMEIKDELNKNIRLILNNYSRETCEVIYAFYFEGIQIKEIALKYHHSINTVVQIVSDFKKEISSFYIYSGGKKQ